MAEPSTNEPTALADAGVPQVVVDDPEQLVGTVILGRFRIDGVLGQGGMGAVFRCRHLGLQRDIAVKVLHPELSGNTEIKARFEREAQTTSRLNHPNCVRVLDFGDFEVGPATMQYLAMELLSGCELTSLLEGGAVDAARTAEVMEQVLAGLEHAHAQGVVHRDLKPENVFVTEDHEGRELLKIVDFGIAKIVAGQGANQNMTVAGTIFGTPRYMSPEQCAGGEIDERTDVYAAGIMLFEMLAGAPPFDDPVEPMKVLHKHLFEPVPGLPASVPASLVALVGEMLAKEKADRMPSIAKARARLLEIRAELRDAEASSSMAAASSAAMSGGGRTAASTVGPTAAPATANDTAMPISSPIRSGQTLRVAGRKPQVWLAIGGGALVAAVVVSAAIHAGSEGDEAPAESAPTQRVGDAASPKPSDSAPSPAPGSTPASVATAQPPSWMPTPAAPTADDAALEELDGLLEAGNRDAAEPLVRRLIDEFPEDARLHLREARVLRESNSVTALGAYSRAIDLEPDLLDDEAIREEVLALMRRPGLEDAALDVAIRELGPHGIGYLVERVNDDAAPPFFADRHRALRTIEEAERGGDVERPLNVALDLWQASDSPAPCETYAAALTTIEADLQAYYLGSVSRSRPPKQCTSLEPQRAALAQTLQGKHVIDEADWVVPQAYASKRGKPGRGRRSPAPAEDKPSSGGGGGGIGNGRILRKLGIR